jgi:TP901 family phage tail tape measure protein
MPSNEIIVRTEQLIKALNEIAKASGAAGASLQETEKFLNRFVGVNLGSIRESALLIANFSRQIKSLGGDAATVNSLTTSFAQLLGKIQETIAMQEKMSSLSKAGVATRRLNMAITSGNVGEQQKQQAIIQQAKRLAEQANEEMRATEQIWKRNLEFANRIEELRAKVISSLLGRATMNRLPSGMIPGQQMLPPGYMAMGAGEELTNQPPVYPPRYNNPQLPPGNIPLQLPVGQIQEPPKLLPAVTTSTNDEISQYFRNQRPAPVGAPQLMSGLRDIDTAINERLQTAAATIETPQVGTEHIVVPPSADKTAVDPAVSQRAQDILKGSVDLNKELFQGYGLSAQAAKNLETSLSGLGMTYGRVTSATTEMSTGITTVGVEAKGAGNVIQNLTAHLDRNGNVLQDTQKRFRSFGSAIMRDVVEVLKWTIAITAIYTPIRKLGEMMEEMKKIQLDLVDVQIVLNNSNTEMNTVLEASADIANQTSSGLEGVVEGYALAAAAASSAGNEVQRTIATQTLLKDSMVLSKLAGTDQKQALDTLVGTLSQLGMGLTQGTALLDSWVAVSKKANVSVGQMATSFTIVGSAAQEAGLNYNELNALVGALAQSTNLSADELGNSIRGIIAAMQTDKAQQSFAEYGIATKTLSGDFRDLMDILKEMKMMSQTGVLDEKAMGALTQAGGAGARRGAQLSALVKNLDVVMQLITVSESASGDAARAMALEMGTLDAATTRLNNAFSMLALSLGGEGGVLAFLTKGTDLITFFVTQMRSLVSILRVAAPLMAMAFLAKGIAGTSVGASLLGKNIPTGLAKLFTPSTFEGVGAGGASLAGAQTGNKLLLALQGLNIGAQLTQQRVAVTGGQGSLPGGAVPTWGNFLPPMFAMMNMPFSQMAAKRGAISTETAAGLPAGLGKLNLAGILGPAFVVAASNIGKPLEEALPRAISGTVGAALFGVLTGSTMWAIVGATIAQGFYDKFITFEGNIAEGITKYAAGVMGENPLQKPGEVPTNEDFIKLLNTQATAKLTTQPNIISGALSLASSIASALGWSSKNATYVNKMLTGTEGTGKEAIPREAWMMAMGAAENYKSFGITDEAHEIFVEMLKRWTEEQVRGGNMGGDIPMSPIMTQIEQEVGNVTAYATSASIEIMDKALADISNGVTGATANLLEAQTASEKLASISARVIESQQQLATPITLGVKEKGGAKEVVPVPGYEAMGPEAAVKFAAGLSAEEAGAITSSYTELFDAIDDIRMLNEFIAAQEGPVTVDQQKLLDDYGTKLKSVGSLLSQLFTVYTTAGAGRRAEESLMPTVEIPENITPKQLQEAIIAGREAWKQFLIDSGMNPDDVEAYISKQSEMMYEANNKIIENIKSNVPSKFVLPPLQVEAQMPQLQQMENVSKPQWDTMMQQYPQMVAAIQALMKSKGVENWQPTEETTAFMGQGGWFDVQHVDMSILNMLMKDLIDVEKDKGLQGMYNLPSGATFYVPVTAYEMSKATVTEMAGGGGFGSGISELVKWLMQIAQNTAPKDTTTVNEEAKALHREQMIARNAGEGAYKTTPTIPTDKFKNWFSTVPGAPGLSTPVPNATPTPPSSNWWETIPGAPAGLMKEFTAPENQPVPQVPNAIENFGATVGTFITGLTTSLETLLGGLVNTISNSHPFGIGEESQNATPVPPLTSTIPEIKLPTSMTNWFSQQQLTTPASATTVTQQPDQRPITAALNLSVDSNIVLTVDGRTLATIIKPYLYEDLLRFGTGMTTSTSRNIIA